MNITKASIKDIPNIMNIFSECILLMESKEIMQWNEYYPTSTNIESDIHNNSAHIIMDDTNYMAYFCIDESQPEEYEQINWSCSEGKKLVIHRLAVHPPYQRKGLAHMAMNFIEDYASQSGYSGIRLDVYSGNEAPQKLYLHRGFTCAGEVFFPYRSLPFYCMEKTLILSSSAKK